jgi:hypothetical protein
MGLDHIEKAAMVKPVSEKTCVLYDLQDGRIVHTHRVVALSHGREMTEEELEERARACARQMGHNIDGLSALHLSTMDHDNSSAYRVDVANKQLVKKK